MLTSGVLVRGHDERLALLAENGMCALDGGVNKCSNLEPRSKLVLEAEGVVPWAFIGAYSPIQIRSRTIVRHPLCAPNMMLPAPMNTTLKSPLDS
jgi:hypothetical protein